MGRMEQHNLDETMPTRLKSDEESQNPLLSGETVLSSTGLGKREDSDRNPEESPIDDPVFADDLAATVAMPSSDGRPVQDEALAGPLSAIGEPGFEDTLPPPAGMQGIAQPVSTPPSVPPTTKPAKPLSWRAWTLLGVLGLILVAVLSALSGYQAGITLRTDAEATQVSLQLDDQFELGLQDMQAKRYDLARQRFEYVIQMDPSYPEAQAKLAEVLLELNTTATPTTAPTPTPTPTPDLRGVEELFSQAQQSLANKDWSAAIDTLLSLRKADPAYQAVWVDDMLYVSYRNRGADKILKEGDLEGGIYDLSLAERFGPLDTDAKGYLTWARLYITGASFWEIDWGQAVYYFGQVAPALPNLRDGSGWTAAERYRLALIGYGESLANNKDWCAAQEQYEIALTLGSDPAVEETLDFVRQKCSGEIPEEVPSTEEVPSENPTSAPLDMPPPTQIPPPPAAPLTTPGP